MKKQKAIYLTYSDGYSGVYKSQVIDVINFYAENEKIIRLVALMSIRHFFSIRKKIKCATSDAIVLPMFPKLKNIKINTFTLKLLGFFYKFNNVVARGPLATYLAQRAFSKKNIRIVYDGRGANKEEEREYNINNGALSYEQISNYEKSAVLNSDFRIAVSNKLIEYWQREFDYNDAKHIIMPCMLGKSFESGSLDNNEILKKRQKIGFTNEDIILVYSGSVAGWQSFEFLQRFLETQLDGNKHIKVMFLSKENQIISYLQNKYLERVKRFWLKSEDVFDYLRIGDYGILFREQTVTNKVASPVKFAEYLSAGLQVIISPNLGDFSEFVLQNNCGVIINDNNLILQKPKTLDKQKMRKMALCHFKKDINKMKYII